MFIIKFILIEISLVLITTVYNGSSTYTCEDLIDEEESFQKGEENAVSNFQNAYRNLTLGQIREIRAFHPDDSDDIKNKKIMRRDVTRGYFYDLFKGRRLNYGNVLFPKNWCTVKVEEIIPGITTINIAHFEDQVEICKGWIYQFLFKKLTYQPAQANSLITKFLFKHLYENWSYKKIQEHIDSQRTQNLTFQKQMELSYIEHYALGYFQHFDDYYVKDERHNQLGGFRSIESYCADDGYKYMNKNENDNESQ